MNRPDLAEQYKHQLIAASTTELRDVDLVVTVTDTIVSETVRIVLRPATKEECR